VVTGDLAKGAVDRQEPLSVGCLLRHGASGCVGRSKRLRYRAGGTLRSSTGILHPIDVADHCVVVLVEQQQDGGRDCEPEREIQTACALVKLVEHAFRKPVRRRAAPCPPLPPRLIADRGALLEYRRRRR